MRFTRNLKKLTNQQNLVLPARLRVFVPVKGHDDVNGFVYDELDALML